jgi:heme oxygenase
MNSIPAPKDTFTDQLRLRTRALHGLAERSGVVCDLLQRRATRASYALLLRNLLPAYQCLERGLDRHRDTPEIAALALPSLYRTSALETDLQELCGRDWRDALPLLPAGERYAETVAAAAEGRGERLAAHAYVRYLGDLNGGRVLKPLLERSLGLPLAALTFYAFPQIPDLEGFKAQYRDALEGAGSAAADPAAILAEAELAFRLNIAVSEAVQQAVAKTGGEGTSRSRDR